VVGAYAALSPIWTDTDTKATWTLVVLGVVTVVVALASLASPGLVASEAAIAVLGVLLFISPWVMNFHSIDGISWTAWVTGVLAFLLGISALPESNAVHRGMVAQH
jgi:peptidoglycan/LPS O-acetylase OafA/YrhL